jgi:hypothetical protein
MRVQQELNRLPPRNSVRGGDRGIFGCDVIHSSALVRYCARYDFHNGRDIFAALYLAKQPSGDGLDWGHEASDLVESLQREKESYENGEENEEEE